VEIKNKALQRKALQKSGVCRQIVEPINDIPQAYDSCKAHDRKI